MKDSDLPAMGLTEEIQPGHNMGKQWNLVYVSNVQFLNFRKTI
jgi:hypothetical protein